MRNGTFDLHDRAIGGGLADWLRAQRAEGVAWNEIAYRLRTEHDLKVSVETLRRWFAGLEEEAPTNQEAKGA